MKTLNKVTMNDLEYYRGELARILPLASVYPLTVVVGSDTSKTKTLNLNAASIKALTELFETIENLEVKE